MIREVTSLADVSLPQIERLGRLFAEESGAGTFDLGHFNRMFSVPLEMGIAKMWVIDKDDTIVGILGGMVSELFFVKTMIGIEAFWYVDPENRGSLAAMRLLEAFEDWSVKQGAVWTHLAFMEKIHPEKLREFYEKRGYEKFESVYRKKN